MGKLQQKYHILNSTPIDVKHPNIYIYMYIYIYCRERSEVTLHFRPFIFNGILILLIRLHGYFFHKFQEGGRENQLLDGYIYLNSDFTEWKLIVPNICISNFMTIPSSVNFLQPILVLAVKV